jgi:hypothetical protein
MEEMLLSLVPAGAASEPDASTRIDRLSAEKRALLARRLREMTRR